MFQWITFGKVKYDNSVFSQDIVISTDGDVYQRQAGDPLRVTAEELDASIDSNTKTVVVGTGHYDIVKLTPEAMSYLKDMKIDLVEKHTPEAIDYYNKRMKVKGRKPAITAIIHVK
ncbi:MAG: hypothetical protein KAW41_02005 [Candidatus Diapherotrites archaeon]|nr:hypothetical protein [Candidatus Diapherotrites archaeon]